MPHLFFRVIKMQVIRLEQPTKNMEKYFEPSEQKEGLFDVYQRVFVQSIMMFKTYYIGTFSKNRALEMLNSNSEIVENVLNEVNEESDIKIPDEFSSFVPEPVNHCNNDKFPHKEPEKEVILNPIDLKPQKKTDIQLFDDFF